MQVRVLRLRGIEGLNNSTELGKGTARIINPSLPKDRSRLSKPLCHAVLKDGQARRCESRVRIKEKNGQEFWR